MKPLHRRILIFVVAIVVIIVGYVGYRYYETAQRRGPQEFSEARSKGSAIAEKIVASSNEVNAAIAQLGSATTTTTNAQASSTIAEVNVKIAEIRDQALELSEAMGTMAAAVPEIRSPEAQQAALKAIAARLDLIEHLVIYTDQVSRLTSAIRLRIEKKAQNNTEILKLVKDINAEVRQVNRLNGVANESMEQFDSLLR